MKLRYLLIAAVLLASCVTAPNIVRGPGLAALKPTRTPGPTSTPKVTATFTPVPTTPVPTNTLPAPTGTPLPTDTPVGETAPYPTAPLCTTHDNSLFHTLWNSAGGGCHYDHEHGDDPAQVPALLGIDPLQFTGGQSISYPWQTTDENLLKHEGYKWTVRATNEDPCVAAEVGPNGTDGYAVEFHAKGGGVEHLTRNHSSFIMVRVCNSLGQSGILVTGGHQDYGQRVSTYQSGIVLAIDGQPQPPYGALLSPYLSLDCFNDDGAQTDCGNKFTRSGSTWVSRPQAIECCHQVAQLLFRSRDPYQWINGTTRLILNGQTFRWVCGVTEYNPADCDANNTTVAVHQVFGNVPTEWDLLDGVADGLVTWQGFTDRWGNVVEGCIEIGLDCVPLYLSGVPVGQFSGTFDDALPATSPEALPERDIYFCAGIPCGEADSGEVPSGWVGSDN